MKEQDYGFYGKGVDGYVHYKQSVDRISSADRGINRPQQRTWFADLSVKAQLLVLAGAIIFLWMIGVR